jgi:hypothetical protein
MESLLTCHIGPDLGGEWVEEAEELGRRFLGELREE